MTEMQQLMDQAKKMQESMQQAQQELTSMTIIGQSSNGLVKITMNGRHQALSTWIDYSIMDEDKEDIEKWITEAVNSCSDQIEKASQEKIVSLTSNMELPPELQEMVEKQQAEGGAIN